MRDLLEDTAAIEPVLCRTPSPWAAAAAGLGIFVCAMACVLVLFKIPESRQSWVAGGILIGGTVALGVYTSIKLRRR